MREAPGRVILTRFLLKQPGRRRKGNQLLHPFQARRDMGVDLLRSLCLGLLQRKLKGETPFFGSTILTETHFKLGVRLDSARFGCQRRSGSSQNMTWTYTIWNPQEGFPCKPSPKCEPSRGPVTALWTPFGSDQISMLGPEQSSNFD